MKAKVIIRLCVDTGRYSMRMAHWIAEEVSEYAQSVVTGVMRAEIVRVEETHGEAR